MMQKACENYCRYLETLTLDTLPDLPKYVSTNVHFQDPFKDVHGVDAMIKIFKHMFETIGPVKFTVYHAQSNGGVCLLSWGFQGRLFGKPWQFDGTSVVTFDESGLVTKHKDYWDAARHFYERLPVIGWTLAWIRRRLARK